MTDEKDVKIEFPCEYFIKVMMKAEEETRTDVHVILAKHIANYNAKDHQTRPSSKGTFESLTVHFWAESEAHIMTMFGELKEHDGVKMVL